MTAIYSAVIFFVILDRFLKGLAIRAFEINIVGQILKFNLVKNFYIAFSLPLFGFWLNAVIFLIIFLLLYFFIRSWRDKEQLAGVCLFAIILGASSNLLDRLKYGYVIDYFDLKYFTVFNLADAMIVIGVLLLLVASYKKEAK